MSAASLHPRPVWRLIFLSVGTALLAGAPAVQAQTPLTEHTITSDGSPPQAAEIAVAAWLTGRWKGEGLGAEVEEVWLPAAAGAMTGVFRLVRGDSVSFYELVTLRKEGRGLVLRLRHFEPNLVGWEEREEVVTFPLLEVGPNTLWFDGLTMRRVAEDRLHVWAALQRPGEGIREALFAYRRVGGAGTAVDPSR